MLGLVRERPGYGYELADRMQRRLGPAWGLGTSSVYPILDALKKADFLVATEVELPRPRQNRRTMYHITDAGRQAFDKWMVTPPAREAIRPDMIAKIAVAGPEHVDELIANLDQYERDCMALMHGAEATRAVGTWESLVHDLIAEQAEQRLTAEVNWVGYARDRLMVIAQRKTQD